MQIVSKDINISMGPELNEIRESRLLVNTTTDIPWKKATIYDGTGAVSSLSSYTTSQYGTYQNYVKRSLSVYNTGINDPWILYTQLSL